MGTLERTLCTTVADAMPLAQSVFDTLARDTADPAGGVTRASYGEGEQYAHSLLARVARDLDLEVTSDAGGNLYMTLPGRDRGTSAPLARYARSAKTSAATPSPSRRPASSRAEPGSPKRMSDRSTAAVARAIAAAISASTQAML